MPYSVEFTAPAERDLLDIYTYVAGTLKAPEAALGLYETLRAEINSLAFMPERHAVIDEPPYRERGVRKLLIENYIAFYLANRESRTVSILRILYNRREWRALLGI